MSIIQRLSVSSNHYLMFNFPTSVPKRISLLLLAAFFILAGLNHFLNKKFYVSMMPPYLPAHLAALVYAEWTL
jgi:hypothetical protein